MLFGHKKDKIFYITATENMTIKHINCHINQCMAANSSICDIETSLQHMYKQITVPKPCVVKEIYITEGKSVNIGENLIAISYNL